MSIADPVMNQHDQISLATARTLKTDAQVREGIEVDVTPIEIGRVAAVMAKEVILERLRAAERDVG